MHSGNVEPARNERVNPVSGSEVSAEQAHKAAASGDRETPSRKENTRPWSVRRADSPSWVEKIEQF